MDKLKYYFVQEIAKNVNLVKNVWIVRMDFI